MLGVSAVRNRGVDRRICPGRWWYESRVCTAARSAWCSHGLFATSWVGFHNQGSLLQRTTSIIPALPPHSPVVHKVVVCRLGIRWR